MSYGTVQAEKVTTESGYSLGAGNASSFKNRLINGAMTIDQRNAGVSVSRAANSGDAYQLDRWLTANAADAVYTVQQVSDAPTGFINSLKITVTTADSSLGSSQINLVRQNVEGLNVSDLAWGSASAKSVTLSFWVKSSLTGQFGGSMTNAAANRTYPFNYTISAANTWEQKSITVSGDTTGTWLTTNGIGIRLDFNIGTGSTFLGTANAWAASNMVGTIGDTSVVGTLNATWQITGAQLEVGTVATSFDYRPYGTEFSLCQRYYYKIANTSDATSIPFGIGYTRANNAIRPFINFQVQMRVRPTSVETSGTASHYQVYYAGDANATCTSVPSFDIASRETALLGAEVSGTPFPSGGVTYLRSNSTSAYLAFSAEL